MSRGHFIDEAKEKQTPLRTLYDWAGVLCTSLALAVGLFLFFRPAIVRGESMWPTLESRDRLFLHCFLYKPARGDIVVIDRDGDYPLIKRVIAVAGDTLYIDNSTGAVHLNGEVLTEPYIDMPTPPVEMTEAVTVPNGYIFVMGDNRQNSHDSRYADIGLIDVNRVVGKAFLRVYPLDSIGRLDN